MTHLFQLISNTSKLIQKPFLLLTQGLGYLTSLTLPGVERQRTFSGGSSGSGECPSNKAALGAIGRRRTLSMEEYDLPRPRRLSLSANNANGVPVPGSPTK
jgi:protein NDRG1